MSNKCPRRLGRCFGNDMRTKAGRGPLGFGRHLGGVSGSQRVLAHRRSAGVAETRDLEAVNAA